jgi:hypothetical protein
VTMGPASNPPSVSRPAPLSVTSSKERPSGQSQNFGPAAPAGIEVVNAIAAASTNTAAGALPRRTRFVCDFNRSTMMSPGVESTRSGSRLLQGRRASPAAGEAGMISSVRTACPPSVHAVACSWRAA